MSTKDLAVLMAFVSEAEAQAAADAAEDRRAFEAEAAAEAATATWSDGQDDCPF